MVASHMGSGEYNEKVDIWSFGMLLFELLTLDVPYRRDNFGRFDLPEKVASGVRPSADDELLNDANLVSVWRFYDALTQVDADKRLSAHGAVKKIKKLLLKFGKQ